MRNVSAKVMRNDKAPKQCEQYQSLTFHSSITDPTDDKDLCHGLCRCNDHRNNGTRHDDVAVLSTLALLAYRWMLPNVLLCTVSGRATLGLFVLLSL